MHRPECNAHNYLFNLEKSNKGFFLYYIPCKEDKSWQNFKIKRKLLFNFSSYAHPEICEFQGVTNLPPLKGISSSRFGRIKKDFENDMVELM
jgi:hypothetical protein